MPLCPSCRLSFRTWALAALLFVGLLPGCKHRYEELIDNAPLVSVTAKDGNGAAIRFEVPPKRVVSLDPTVTEIIYAIGADPKLVAVSESSVYPAPAEQQPKVALFPQLDYQTLVDYKPQCVFYTHLEVANTDVLENQLSQLGAQPFFLRFDNLADITQSIRTLGTILAARGPANYLADSIDVVVKRFRNATAKDARYNVAIIQSLEPLRVVAGQHFLNDALQAAGGQNVFADVKAPYYQTNFDTLQARAPEYLIILLPYFDLQKEAQKNPALMYVKAVELKQIYQTNALDIYFRPGVQVLNILAEMTSILHSKTNIPALFEPVGLGTPEAIDQ